MLQRLLVPLDGSKRAERAVSLAARIARVAHGSVVLLRVVESEKREQEGPGGEGSALQAMLEEAYAYLLAIRRQMPAELPVQCVVHAGPVVPSLLLQAKEHAIDLMVLCNRGETGDRGMLLQSVTQYLACQSPLPILVLHPESPVPESAYPSPSRPLHTVEVLVALDGSPYTASALLPAVHLVTALTAPAPGIVHLLQILPSDNEDEATQARQYLQRLVTGLKEGLGERLPLDVIGSLIRERDVRAELVRVAEHGVYGFPGGCEFIVMVTRRRTSLGSWVSGSMTEYVLEESKLPLLIVPGSDQT